MNEERKNTALADLVDASERLIKVMAEREWAVVAARRNGATLAEIALAAGITEAGASKMCHRLGAQPVDTSD